MGELAERGRDRLADEGSWRGAVATLEETISPAQRAERALFEALDDERLENDDIRAGHAALLAVLDGLVARAQAAGAIRADVGAIDVLRMTKGVCEAIAPLRAPRPGDRGAPVRPRPCGSDRHQQPLARARRSPVTADAARRWRSR